MTKKSKVNGNSMESTKGIKKTNYKFAVQTEEFEMKKAADANKINENSRW